MVKVAYNIPYIANPSGIRFDFSVEKCKPGWCTLTRDDYSVTVRRKSIKDWLDGAQIKKVFPDLSTDDSEFLITGISPQGQKDIYG